MGKKTRGRGEGDVSIYFMPYSDIAKDDSVGRLKKIMGIILQNKIIILQGKLKPEEEVKLIENTMTLIGNIKDFHGIEIASLSSSENVSMFQKFKHGIARILIGDQDAVTIIGPAKVVKEMKRDPKKIELFLNKK